jgi:arginase family enzyme
MVAASLGGAASRVSAEVVAAVDAEGTATPVWTDIETDTYDKRAHFTAGVNRLSARLDDQIRVLKAKRAGMTTDLKDWDLAFKEVEESRTYLTGCMNDLDKATAPETWADAKDKVGVAWKRSQVAVDKMNGTVTS